VPPEQSARALLRGVLAEGIAAGRVREMSVDLACELVLGVVIQPVIGALYGHVSTPISDCFEDIYAALERVLAPPHPQTATVAARRPEAAGLPARRQLTRPARTARR
jgi:hypothetical protein